MKRWAEIKKKRDFSHNSISARTISSFYLLKMKQFLKNSSQRQWESCKTHDKTRQRKLRTFNTPMRNLAKFWLIWAKFSTPEDLWVGALMSPSTVLKRQWLTRQLLRFLEQWLSIGFQIQVGWNFWLLSYFFFPDIFKESRTW